MICSSLNLERVRLPYFDGLYTNPEEFQGLRSVVISVQSALRLSRKPSLSSRRPLVLTGHCRWIRPTSIALLPIHLQVDGWRVAP
jgi:hypothetical protein